jgi:hypothetical protein
VRARFPVELNDQTTSDSPAQQKFRFPSQFCLRQGCDRQYGPAANKQGYCHDSDCLREVHRWLAFKRQQRPRVRPAVRAAEAAVAKRNANARSRRKPLRLTQTSRQPRMSGFYASVYRSRTHVFLAWKQRFRCFQFRQWGDLQRVRSVSFEELASTEFPSVFPLPWFPLGCCRIQRGLDRG